MFKYKFQKYRVLISGFMAVFILFSAGFVYAKDKDSRERQSLMLVVVEQTAYEQTQKEINRYLQDAKTIVDDYYGHAKVEIILIDRNDYAIQSQDSDYLSETEEKKLVLDLVTLLEVKYREAGLVGITLIGKIPIPQVFNGSDNISSLYPYIDFDQKAYLYNSSENRFERTTVATPIPEIWIGYIPAEWKMEDHETDLKYDDYFPTLEQYFNDNHNYHTGKTSFEQHLLINDFFAEDKAKQAEDPEQAWNDYLNDLEEKVSWTGRYEGINRADDDDGELKSIDVGGEVINYFNEFNAKYDAGMEAASELPRRIINAFIEESPLSGTGTGGQSAVNEPLNEILHEAKLIDESLYLRAYIAVLTNEDFQYVDILHTGQYWFCTNGTFSTGPDFFNDSGGTDPAGKYGVGPDAWHALAKKVAEYGPTGALVKARDGAGSIKVNGIIQPEYFLLKPGDQMLGNGRATFAEVLWFDPSQEIQEVLLSSSNELIKEGQRGFNIPLSRRSYSVPPTIRATEFYIIWQHILKDEADRRVFLVKEKIPPFGKYEELNGNLEMVYTVAPGDDYLYDLGGSERLRYVFPTCLFNRRYHNQSLFEITLGAPVGKLPNKGIQNNLAMFTLANGFQRNATLAVVAQMAQKPTMSFQTGKIPKVLAESIGPDYLDDIDAKLIDNNEFNPPVQVTINEEDYPYDPYGNTKNATARVVIDGITNNLQADVKEAFDSKNKELINQTVNSFGNVGFSNPSTDDAKEMLIGFENYPFILSLASGMPLGEALKNGFDETQITYGDPLMRLKLNN